ncbi:hypothetical protein OSB04_008885 [Centaurea solstitialis]|uniref:ascorbate ferrireductase (transmembrane) n=1 Tax=Centaurea solstitialis TaxID=347529 RepID=A0AA38TZE9_9ASTR|nr:hypothetical protein OSB04_008885 [Centaurea solstitialis]
MAHDRSSYRVSALPITVFTHLLVVAIVTLVLVWLINFREGFAFTSQIKPKIFNLHPLLMVLGFIVFSGKRKLTMIAYELISCRYFEPAMITYKSIPASRQVLKLIHLFLHLIALASGIVGVYAVFKFHDESHIPHMYTLHSWIGLGTICLFGLQPLIVFTRFLLISIVTLVLIWLIKFREGFAFTSKIKAKIFNLHPLLMVLGFIIHSGEVMMSYKFMSGPGLPSKVMCLILQSISLAAGIVGVYAVFKFHNEVHIPHMYTLHSWIGLSTICLFGFQLLLGFLSLLFRGPESATRTKLAICRASFSVVIYLMAIVTAVTGLTEEFLFERLKHGQEALIVNFIGLLLLFLGTSVALVVVLPLYM